MSDAWTEYLEKTSCEDVKGALSDIHCKICTKPLFATPTLMGFNNKGAPWTHNNCSGCGKLYRIDWIYDEYFLEG